MQGSEGKGNQEVKMEEELKKRKNRYRLVIGERLRGTEEVKRMKLEKRENRYQLVIGRSSCSRQNHGSPVFQVLVDTHQLSFASPYRSRFLSK